MQGDITDYEKTQARLASDYRVLAGAELVRGNATELATVVENPPSLADAIRGRGRPSSWTRPSTAGGLSCRLDALERCRRHRGLPSSSSTPRRSPGDNGCFSRSGAPPGPHQGAEPARGKVLHGSPPLLAASRVHLGPLLDEARGVIREIEARSRDKGVVPQLVLNQHCVAREFRKRCREVAVARTTTSACSAACPPRKSPGLNGKGIFSIAQYSHTFRPRRRKQKAESGGPPAGPPAPGVGHPGGHGLRRERAGPAAGPVHAYLDVEGLPDRGFHYLIGLVVGGDAQAGVRLLGGPAAGRRLRPSGSLPEAVGSLGDLRAVPLRELRVGLPEEDGPYCTAATPNCSRKIEARSVNVLSLIYSRVFFPVHSNDLKSVAYFLGFRWSGGGRLRAPSPSSGGTTGRRPETSRLKQRLLTYNRGLPRPGACRGSRSVPSGPIGPPGGDGTGPRGRRRSRRCKTPRLAASSATPKFALARVRPDHEVRRTSTTSATRCSAAPAPPSRRAIRRKERRTPTGVQGQPRGRVRRVADRLPALRLGPTSARGADIRRLVDRPEAVPRRCQAMGDPVQGHAACRLPCGCLEATLPAANHYRAVPSKYGWGLCSWVAYATIVAAADQRGRRSKPSTTSSASASASAAVSQVCAARRPTTTGATYEVPAGRPAEGAAGPRRRDEGRRSKGPARAATCGRSPAPTSAVYVYAPTREGDTLRETLAGFKGVLVSDFYAAYDAMDCPQQKCLIHLIRDLNDDLLKNPFDEELSSRRPGSRPFSRRWSRRSTATG